MNENLIHGILQSTAEKTKIFEKAEMENSWFAKLEVERMIESIAQYYLQKDKYDNWLSSYKTPHTQKTIGLIAAGNIPLVLFHDLLCILSLGYKAKIKLSAKDSILPQWLIGKMIDFKFIQKNQIEYVEQIKDIDAIIATGSDLSGNYFKTYFGKYPHIIRTHRNSIAILSGNESDDELIELGKDVFSYYGLGCRNVSKLYFPPDYNIIHLLKTWDENFSYVIYNNKYKNNFDYNLALLMLNKSKFYQSSTTLLLESESLNSRIATIHYEYYESTEKLLHELRFKLDKIQDLITNISLEWPSKRIGQSQFPQLNDYADGIDTMKFLLELG